MEEFELHLPMVYIDKNLECCEHLEGLKKCIVYETGQEGKVLLYVYKMTNKMNKLLLKK